MRFIKSIVHDAVRPASVKALYIQKQSESRAPVSPLEEQDDGAFTVYRFQKAGDSVSSKVSGSVAAETGSTVPQSASPSVPAVDVSASSADKISSTSSEITGDYVNWSSGLATGEAQNVKKRQGSKAHEWQSLEFSDSPSVSHDGSVSSSSVYDLNDPLKTQLAEAIQHGKNEQQRWAPGPDAPSETNRSPTINKKNMYGEDTNSARSPVNSSVGAPSSETDNQLNRKLENALDSHEVETASAEKTKMISGGHLGETLYEVSYEVGNAMLEIPRLESRELDQTKHSLASSTLSADNKWTNNAAELSFAQNPGRGRSNHVAEQHNEVHIGSIELAVMGDANDAELLNQTSGKNSGSNTKAIERQYLSRNYLRRL